MRPLPLLAALLAAVALAACGSSSSSSPSSSSSSSSSSSATSSGSGSSSDTGTAAAGAQPVAVAVAMKSLAFSPKTIDAKVGQTIVFTNDDSPPHNVTYVSGPKFASSSTINPGGKFSLKLTQPGTIHYFCSIHPFMKGTIVVTP